MQPHLLFSTLNLFHWALFQMSLLPLLDISPDDYDINSFKFNALGAIFGFLIPILIPFIHFGLFSHLWDEFNYRVNRIHCTCPCWDTVFKGIYERGPAGYKHVYFNVTSNTLKIWIVTVLAILFVYEVTKRAVRLIWVRSARLSMVILLSSSIYPHYYSFWAYFNYWNDDYYKQWNHQLYFTVTELISTIVVIILLDKKVTISARKILIITNIAVMHILSAGFDQFVENVVRGNGQLHQVLRDLFFMIPDFLHIILPLWELHFIAKNRNVDMVMLISNYEFICSLTFVVVGWFIAMSL